MTTKESARKFQFLREIASGGFGSVYLAKVTHADGFSRLVAVKLLHRRWSENDEIAARMRDEARLLGWLRHRNIVDVMDLTLIDGRCAVLMEYLEAVDTRVIVETCRQDATRVPVGVALEIAAAVCSALDAAFNRPPYAGEKPLRVIHRDIKPSNIMLDELGVVKVLDFGVARAEFDAREAKTAELSFGSLEYMPPERLFFEPESPASDVYSLGTTLYELLALEKLGKAKLRQSEQQKFVLQRFADLVETYPLASQEVKDELGSLLTEMLAFDEADRPTAADAATRMRAFARTLGDPSAEAWAEAHVPPLILRVRERDEGDGATLVGKTIIEDISGFWEDSLEAPPEREASEDGLQPTHVEPLMDLDDEYTTGRDNTGWSQLKQATLDSLAETGELSARTVEEVRRSSPVAVAEWLADDATDPEAAMPTVRMRAGSALDDELHPPVIMDDETRFVQGPLVPPHTADVAAMPPRSPDETAPPHPERDSSPPAEPGRNWIGIILSMVLLLAIAGLMLVLVTIIGGAGAVYFTRPTVEPAPVEVLAPASVPHPVAPDPVAEGGASFVSMWAGTKKLAVRCDAGEAAGVSEVQLAGPALGDCTVTAIDAFRARRTAVIKGVELRRYECFAADASECK